MKPLFTGPSSEDFRQKELWTRDVNLIFDANKRSIYKLYDFCAKGKIRKLSIDEAVKLMT